MSESKIELVATLRGMIRAEKDMMDERVRMLETKISARLEIEELKMLRALTSFRTSLRVQYAREIREMENTLRENQDMKKAAYRAMIEHMFADMCASNDRGERKKWCSYDFVNCECWRCKKVRARKRPPPCITATITPLQITEV